MQVQGEIRKERTMKAILRILLGTSFSTICAVLGASQTIALWAKEKAGSPIPVTGLAQVGVGGLSKVQVWIHPQDKEWPTDDPYFEKAPWADAKILPPPTDWGGDLPGGKLPPDVQFFTKEGKPEHWPMRDTIAHWATLLKDIPPGKYNLYCRSLDDKGIAQPMPRPFRKSGANAIQKTTISVES
jgi:hypothetical protein